MEAIDKNEKGAFGLLDKLDKMCLEEMHKALKCLAIHCFKSSQVFSALLDLEFLF
jgi:hypothetical protein